jgi:hypothetical protein
MANPGAAFGGCKWCRLFFADFLKWFDKGMGASRPGPLMARAPTDFMVANLPETRRDAPG